MKTAVILAGGKGSRMNFAEKALLVLYGKPIINHIVETLNVIVDEVIIVARDEKQGSKFKLEDVKITYDIVKDFGPVAGICAGLQVSGSEYSFVCACDMPFINPQVVKLLFDCAKGYDVGIAFPFEPLHAVYRREPTLAIAKKAITEQKGAIMWLVDHLDAHYIAKERIKEIDPELRTFININRWEDVEAIIQKI